MATTTEPSRLLSRTLAGLYGLEAAIVVIIFALYKLSDDPAPVSTPGLVLALGVIVAVAAVMLISTDLRAATNLRSFWFTAILNFATVGLGLVVLESGLRIIDHTVAGFGSLFPRSFLPRDWGAVVRANQELLQRASDGNAWGGSFLVHDDMLGWTVGPSRSSRAGFYASSIEGLRSAKPGDSYEYARTLRRIAIVGDSYTFGMDVRFADTWGERLREHLGDRFAVLNFGVDGYGIDQAYLRYLKDAQPWQPEIVILGLIAHDLSRSMVVYPFISFPSWQFPFSKPRFVLNDGRPHAVNLPLPSPAELFAVDRVTSLPQIDLEPGYFAPDWARRWYHSLYSVRAALSLAPAWPAPDAAGDEATASLNAAILGEFVARARRAGSRPVIAYFPSYGAGELDRQGPGQPRHSVRVARKMLAATGLEFADLTPCLRDLAPEMGVADDGAHYSADANALVAACLRDYLGELQPTETTATAEKP